MWAFARREALELLRDRVRLTFGLAIPVFLLTIFSFGISFDVEHLTYAAFDRDQSAQSRALLRSFEGSRYFEERNPVRSEAESDRRLASGELRLVVGIPPGFGKDLLLGRKPEISIWIDGANTFRAETACAPMWRGSSPSMRASWPARRPQAHAGWPSDRGSSRASSIIRRSAP